MYTVMLIVHSWVRWAVIAAGIAAAYRAISGASVRRPWTYTDDRAGFWFTMLLDLQVLFGLVLYFFLSPFTMSALSDFGGAMRNSQVRFWAIEHGFGMIVALALAHVGRARARKVPEIRRHKVAAIFFVFAVVVMLGSIPWPGMPAGRPLFRW